MTKDTLEQKIMGIQKFKMNLANAIVNIDNASLKNVAESNIVGLFDSMIGPKQHENKSDGQNDQLNKFIPFGKLLGGMANSLFQAQNYNKEY